MRRVIQKDPKAEFYRNSTPTLAVRENCIEFIFETESDNYCVVNLSSTKDSVVLLARIGDKDFDKILANTLSDIDGWEDDSPVLSKLLSGKIPYHISSISNSDGRNFAGILRRIFGRQKEFMDMIGDKNIRKEAYIVGQTALLLYEELSKSPYPSLRELSSLFTD